MSIHILVGKLIINIFSVYAAQPGLSVIEKDSFYTALLSNISTVSPDQYLLVCGDFNGHVGKAPEGFNGVHGGCGFGSGNDGTRTTTAVDPQHSKVKGQDICLTKNYCITISIQKIS